jgi:hypothetical protein
VIFGIIAFVVAQVSFVLIGAVTGRSPPMVASLPAMFAVGFSAHVVFGVAVVGVDWMIMRFRGPVISEGPVLRSDSRAKDDRVS